MSFKFWFYLPVFFAGFLSADNVNEKKWVVFFEKDAEISEFRVYDWVVLDRFYHPPVRPLRDQNKTVFGYVNVGETEEYTPWFREVEEEGILLVPNKDWPGSHMIDLRDPKWTKRLIEEIIPLVLYQGFNGLFLDTLDNAAFLESIDGEKYAGMKQAAIEIVKTIKQHYPEIKLMINRGLDISSEIAPHIDILLGEVLFTDYNFETKGYFWNTEEDTQQGIDLMKKAKKLNPDLVLFTLDYWNPGDKQTIRKIYKRSREEGFIPYVSTIDLDKIYPEP